MNTMQPDQLRNPDWMRPNIDVFPMQAVESRYKLLEKLAEERQLVLAYHEDFPGLGYVVRTEDSFDWIPARAEMLGVVQGTC